MRLHNEVAIITGGSRGIGKEVARRFLLEGAKVVIVARNSNEIDETVTELKEYGVIEGFSVDISKKSEVEKLVRHVVNCYQKVDILVNAAGIQDPIGEFIECNIDAWQENLKVNICGTAICSYYVLPWMIKNNKGKIINFSGGGANYSRPNFSAYGTSKAAIVRFTEILADEVKRFNIQVNAVAPGMIKTRMTEEILKIGKERSGEEYDKVLKRLKKGFDSIEKAVSLICFLASQNSNFLTGKIISAQWDPWEEWVRFEKFEIDKDLYVLRRIDEREYLKKG